VKGLEPGRDQGQCRSVRRWRCVASSSVLYGSQGAAGLNQCVMMLMMEELVGVAPTMRSDRLGGCHLTTIFVLIIITIRRDRTRNVISGHRAGSGVRNGGTGSTGGRIRCRKRTKTRGGILQQGGDGLCGSCRKDELLGKSGAYAGGRILVMRGRVHISRRDAVAAAIKTNRSFNPLLQKSRTGEQLETTFHGQNS
jgi:hypothetical protein